MMNFFKIDYDSYVQSVTQQEQTSEIRSDKYYEFLDGGYSKEEIDAFLNHWEEEDLDHFQDAYCGQFDSVREFIEDHMECYGYVIPPGIVVDYNQTWENLEEDYIVENGYYFLRNF